LLGHEVYSDINVSQSELINTETWDAGIYFIKIKSNGIEVESTFKFMKI